MNDISFQRKEILKKVKDKTISKECAVAELEKLNSLSCIDDKPLSADDKKAEITLPVKKNDGVIEKIAVIGMSCRYADADTVGEFWDNICEGRNSVKRIERWGKDKNYCGSVIGDIDSFDHNFFGFSHKEACLTDNQQRIFLEEAYHALEDAGYSDTMLSETDCGVFLGCRRGDYFNLIDENVEDQEDISIFSGNDEAILPGRISYFLNMNGPSVSVNTTCTSALTAIHLAAESLTLNECEMALAGGILVMNTESLISSLTGVGMSAGEGKCCPFDEDAKGSFFGDGVGLVVLKKLDKAIDDNDRIYAVISASGINYDGRTNGLTAPSVNAQKRLQRQVYNRYNVDPSDISYVEAHGSGTVMGDALEVQGLTSVFMDHTEKRQYCSIGSVKGNIGNTINSAGAASFIKTVMCLKNKELVPSINCNNVNKLIELEKTPFVISKEHRDWNVPDGKKRIAAINAYAYSGSNVHMVLEEREPQYKAAANEAKENVFVFSAKSKEALKNYLEAFCIFLEESKQVLLDDISYTLAVRRSHYKYRCAFTATSAEELISAVRMYLSADLEENDSFGGSFCNVRKKKNAAFSVSRLALEKNARAEQLKKISDEYVREYITDFSSLYDSREFHIADLPQYCFEKIRCSVYNIGDELTLDEKNVERSPSPITEFSDASKQSIYKYLSSVVAEIIEVDESELDPELNISDYGFESMHIYKLVDRINSDLGTDIKPTAIYEFYNLEGFVEYLVSEYPEQLRSFTGEQGESSKKVSSLSALSEKKTSVKKLSISENDNDEIAIVGISGVMPQCDDLEEFWKRLSNNESMITEIPADRWDWKEFYGDPYTEINKTKSKWGGFMKNIRSFDANFFNISPREAEYLDPQHRMVMEDVWKAIEDSGHKASEFSDTDTGVFTAISSMDYSYLIGDRQKDVQAQTTTGNAHIMLPNRISYFLNTHGISEIVDTACSSSLTAVYHAVNALQRHECSAAIVSAVNIIISPVAYLSFSKSGMLSVDGKARTFDKKAAGYVRGEGVGTIILKPLSKAVEDGDHIYGVIKNICVNHGGRASSLTAPNPRAQADLIRRAWSRSNIDFENVSYIEAHGTATPLGDPIEINGLKKAFAQMYGDAGKKMPEAKKCGIGAVKTNIGHLESAAGMAALFKVLLSMKHGMIPANISFEELNSNIDLNGTPFYLINENVPWEPVDEDGNRIKRIAGISSFGFGGSNAHMVVEEYVGDTDDPSETEGDQLIVLSAKNTDRLRERAEDLRDYIKSSSEKESLSDIAFTLVSGREDMQERLAFTANSAEQVIECLEDYLAGGKNESIYTGNVNKAKIDLKEITTGRVGEELTRILIEDRELDKIANLWVNGVKLDLGGLFDKNSTHRRLALPVYRFAKDEFWIR